MEIRGNEQGEDKRRIRFKEMKKGKSRWNGDRRQQEAEEERDQERKRSGKRRDKRRAHIHTY